MRHWPVVRWGVYALTLLYALYYFANFAAPGNSVQYPLGWWGWFDQSQYMASTRNLLARQLDPAGHWYPLLYPALAVPFVRYWSMHGFFFLDLICLFGAYAGFLSFARRVGVGPLAAVPIFLVTTFAYASIGETWVEPWTTTLSAALIWGLLACAARLLPGQDVWRGWHLLALGLLAGSLPLVRPTDAVLSAIVVLFVLLSGLRGRVLRVRHLGWLMLGGAMIVLPYAALHLRIYGFHPDALHGGREGDRLRILPAVVEDISAADRAAPLVPAGCGIAGALSVVGIQPGGNSPDRGVTAAAPGTGAH